MNLKLKGKKGFTYLLTVSFLLTILIAVFLTSENFVRQDNTQAQQIRINTLNDFVDNINKDIHRASYISGFRALLSLEQEVTASGVFLNNTESSFQEVFQNGTINGAEIMLMQNSSFEDYLTRVQTIGRQTGTLIDLNVTKITLMHSNPFTIQIIVSIDVNISDKQEAAYWEYSQNYTTHVPIYDLRDPLYGVFTQNKIPNTIRQFNKSPLVNGTNVDNLTLLINESYYIASNLSPNFLMRFENNLSPDINGIESIVNILSLSDQDLTVYPSRIKVDYIYFNDLGGNAVSAVQNVPSNLYFVITCDRRELYEISNLTYTGTC